MIKSCVATVMLFIILFSAGNVSGKDSLPVIAVALSTESYEAELKTLSMTKSQIQQLILPTIEFRPGENLEFKECKEALRLVYNLSPTINQVWIRVKLIQPVAGMQNKEIENRVKKFVAELNSHIDFNYTGVILETDKTCLAELVSLVVSSLSVSLKAIRKEIQIAVPCEIVNALGSKIAVYVDRYILNVKDSWRPVMQHLADLKILRPSFLFWQGDDSSEDQQVYLDSYLTAMKFEPELFVLATGQLENIENLLVTVKMLKTRIPTSLTMLAGDLHPFALTYRAGSRPLQAVFVDNSLNSVVILAKIDGSALNPRQLRFISEIGDSYTVKCYDPLSLSYDKGQAFLSEDIIWDKKYTLLQAERSQLDEVRFSESIDVSADTVLNVAEIIARWQRYNSRQKQLIHNYIANSEMDLHFEPPGLGSGFDVSLHYKYFWNDDGSQYWEQTAQYLNGIKLKRTQTFPLPQLEPEKIVTYPLELKLIDSYTYSLEGIDTFRGNECYVISLKPRPEIKEPLYSGKIWIDCFSFRRVKMLLVQNNSSGSITSNTELQYFDLVEGPDGSSLNLLVRSSVQQKVLAAGREFLLERRYRFKNITVNLEDYEVKLQEAFDRKKPMLTETASGLRELVKDKNGIRRVKEKVDTSVWSLIVGTIYDGTFDFPIPLLGASIMDYNFLKSGVQLSAFWAGPILALNLTKRSKSRLTFGGDLFLSALPRHDRLYRNGIEAENEAVYLFSESLGARLSWHPVTDLFIKTTAYLIYEHYSASDNISDDFVLPRNGFTVNPNLIFEYSHRGYRADLTVSFYERLGWKSWGLPEHNEKLQNSYKHAYARFGKQFYFGSFTRCGVELAYFTGFDLDRFSCYQPSVLSSPKIRGIPSGTVSLEKVGVIGLNLGYTIFDFIRLDAYYNLARCYEQPDIGQRFDFQGLEFDFGTIGPWNSYIQGVISFAIDGLPERYSSRWSIYLVMFLPLK